MFRHDLIRVSDGMVTHSKFSDQMNEPWGEIPGGWGLEENHTVVVTDITHELEKNRRIKKEVKDSIAELSADIDLIMIDNLDLKNESEVKGLLKKLARAIL